MSAGSFFYRSYQARMAPRPKLPIVGAPRKKGTKQVQAGGGSGSERGVGQCAGAEGSEQVVIKTVEAGKEVQYSTPDDFAAHTKLSQSEAESYIQLKLDEANKSLEAARKKKDSGAADRAEKEIALYEKTAAILKTRVLAGPEKDYVYSSLGKRDPFMSPFEVPKVYPPVPTNARPLRECRSRNLR